MSVLVELQDVCKDYKAASARQSLVKLLLSKKHNQQDSKVLKSVSLSVKAGETVGILGKNGSGKSTLLKLIAGILVPSSGQIIIKGEVLPLFSWETCFIDDLDMSDNMFLFGALIGLSSREIRSSQERIVSLAGIEGRLKDQLRTFSTGMKARLAISLANEASAEIILLDETLSAGDSEFREFSKKLLSEWKAKGRAIIHVSHDTELVKALSDRCVYLENGELKQVQSKPDDYSGF